MTKGTIVGNDEDGYYLFSYGGDEVAICYGKGLDKYERAYYGLSFKEENRFFSNRTPGFTIIDNASVEIETANRIIHPISKAEADKRGITHPDSCSVDENFDLSDSYGAGDGYFDFYTLATISHDSYTHYEYASVPIDLVYDPARQSPDTLRLELCYRPRVPEGWEKYRYEGGTLSCDISGLAGLQEWNDSLSCKNGMIRSALWWKRETTCSITCLSAKKISRNPNRSSIFNTQLVGRGRHSLLLQFHTLLFFLFKS